MIRISTRSLRASAGAVALLALSVGGISLRAAPITDFDIYAANQVMIGVGTQVHGLVGSGTTLMTGDTSLNGTAGIFGDIRSGSDVSMANNTFVTGTITNPGSFTTGSGVTFGSHVAAIPDLPTLPPATIFSDGVTDMTVGNGATLTLPPGSYNDILLGGAATLNLSAGDYFLNSLTAGNGLTLNVTAPVGTMRLYVTADVNFGGTVAMNVTGNDPHKVYVEALGTGLNAFRIGGGNGTNWTGDVFTPNGDIHLGSGSSQGTVRGYLWAGGNVDLEHGLDVFGPIHVPEPASIALWGIGTLGIAVYGWRKRCRAAISS